MSSNSRSSNSSSPDNGGAGRRIVEDGPEYRSIMMQPLAAPPMPRSFAPLPVKISKPNASSSKSTTSKTSISASPSQWKVDELAALPAGYLLERTNAYVDDASPQTVADRVCDCLRMLSIAADISPNASEDEDELQKNVLRAETQDCVKFAVRLLKDNGMVVVEVQRMAGCSFGFREASRAVLRSAKGMQPMAPKKRFTIPSALPQRSLEVRQTCVRDDFEIAYNMLKSDRSDSLVLALESLEQMTKPCACEAVDVAAKSVLSPDCLKQLVALLEIDGDDMESHWASSVRRKVLAVLANACAAVSSEDLADILSSGEHLTARSFLALLVTSLTDAAKRPHDAYHAVRCLQSLLICKEVETAILEMSLVDVIESAHDVGCSSHDALQQESHKLMAQLQKL
mmetsp:Transcript_15046/g.26035  ORF Transcript_15046/g.26035 Transcript_15046/m.26035 type:complete len:399 (-) Transcript_15046:128-1324(-)